MAEAAIPNMRSVHARLAIIHPTAVISDHAIIGAPAEWRDRDTIHSAVVCDDATIREFVTVHAGCDRQTVIGERTLLMAHSHVGHDVRIGADCEIAPGATIGGCCTIGAGVKIGMNASIKPYVTIGKGARIGMGAVVTKDVGEHQTWVGNPARLQHSWKKPL